MVFPKTTWADGDTWNGAAVNDLETRIATAIGASHAFGNSSGTVALDARVAQVWTATLTGDVVFNFTNVPASGTIYAPQVIATQDGSGSHAVSFTVGGVALTPTWDTGVAVTVNTAAGATTIFNLETFDGGTTWYGQGAN
jgi:hypothetical protein